MAQPLSPFVRTAGLPHLRYWASVLGLALADATSFVLAYLICRAGHSVPSLAFFQGSSRVNAVTIDVFLILGSAYVLVRYLSGDYGRRQLFWDGAKITTVATLIASVPDILMVKLGGGIYSIFPAICSWLFVLAAVPLLRQLVRAIMRGAGIWNIPTAIFGAGTRTIEIAAALRGSLSLGFDVRWLVMETPDQLVPAELSALSPIIILDAAHTIEAVSNVGCRQAIVASEDLQSGNFAEVVHHLIEINIPVAIIPSLNRFPLAGASTNYFFGRDILLMQIRSNVQRLHWRLIKRSFDIVVSALLIALLSPVFLVLSIAIKLDSRGHVTYFQRRVGRGGMEFKCYKFRSMVPNADDLLERWKTENPELYKDFLVSFKLRNDPRITRIGKWLRSSSLDEAPQLWNVLRGDMSLVGPRPIPEQQLRDQYGSAAQLYMRVRPGITGLWQISGRSETTSDQRVVLDEWYILNWSFWYDIVILIQTAWIVFSRKGAY